MGKSTIPETGSQDFPKGAANKTEKNKTELNDTDPSIFPPTPAQLVRVRPTGRMKMDEMDRYRELIKENIDFDLLLQEHPYDEETLEGYVELLGEGGGHDGRLLADRGRTLLRRGATCPSG
jgi:hypothetical protein